MGNNVLFVVSFIKRRFENLYFLAGNFGAVESADEFFRFSGKHRSTNDFDPAGTGILKFSSVRWFYKHTLVPNRPVERSIFILYLQIKHIFPNTTLPKLLIRYAG
jgi:hypothetical protein